jgi:hypothetical protein
MSRLSRELYYSASWCDEPLDLLGPQNFELLLSSQVGVVDSELHAIPQSNQELPKSLLQVWLSVLQQCRDMRLIENVNVVPFSRGGGYCLHQKKSHSQRINIQKNLHSQVPLYPKDGAKSHLARAHRILAAQT